MIVEGVLAETGYHVYHEVLQRNNLMPGAQRGIALLKQDESRHIAYGIYLLSRLLAENESLWRVVEETMSQLLPTALGIISEAFAAYDKVPFDLSENEFTLFAMGQFQKRLQRLEKARGASLAEINGVANQLLDEENE